MNKEAIKGQNKLKLAVEKLEFELFKNDKSRCAVITIEGCGNCKFININSNIVNTNSNNITVRNITVRNIVI